MVGDLDEALLFVDAQVLDWEFLEHEREIQQLKSIADQFKNPELINESPETAPSKRIISAIPEYKGSKTSVGPLVAEKIGLGRLRQACPHFNEWLSQLEEIAN